MHFRDMVEEDRRTALKTIGGTALTAAALAGCMGGGDEEPEASGTPASVDTATEKAGGETVEDTAEATETPADGGTAIEDIGYDRGELVGYSPSHEQIHEEWSPDDPTDVKPVICMIDYTSADPREFNTVDFDMGAPHVYFGMDMEDQPLQDEQIKGVASRGYKGGVEVVAAPPEQVRNAITKDPNTRVVQEEENRLQLEKTVETWIEGEDFLEEFRHSLQLEPRENGGTAVAYALDERVGKGNVIRSNDKPEENLDGVLETLNGEQSAFNYEGYAETNQPLVDMWNEGNVVPELGSATPPSKMIAAPAQITEPYNNSGEVGAEVSNWSSTGDEVEEYEVAKRENGEWTDPVFYVGSTLTDERTIR